MAQEIFLPPGTRLGAFTLEAPLGRGGMGAVYRARNVLTGESRALKVILPTHLEDPDARARFVREMRIAASIDHPNVVRVFEPALDGETLLLPMELVDGMNLRQHLTNALGGARRLLPDEAIPLLVGICEGVAAVHAKGVIHRDLKPANVMLVRGADGALAPKVLDFGAARRADGADEHTALGIAIGTPQYMPPEQLRALKDLDARVDVYAIGVIAYELLTGRRPYEGAAEEIMAKVFTRERYPSPRELVPTIPDGLDAVILRALAYERDARFESVRALCDALAPRAPIHATPEDPRSSELVVERPSQTPTHRPRAALALAAVALALIVATAFLRRPSPRQVYPSPTHRPASPTRAIPAPRAPVAPIIAAPTPTPAAPSAAPPPAVTVVQHPTKAARIRPRAHRPPRRRAIALPEGLR